MPVISVRRIFATAFATAAALSLVGGAVVLTDGLPSAILRISDRSPPFPSRTYPAIVQRQCADLCPGQPQLRCGTIEEEGRTIVILGRQPRSRWFEYAPIRVPGDEFLPVVHRGVPTYPETEGRHPGNRNCRSINNRRFNGCASWSMSTRW
jgi:hypothetical protein